MPFDLTWEGVIPALMFMTIGAALIFGIVQFALFLRKRRNRDAASRAFSGDGRSELARKAEQTPAERR